MAGMGNMSWKTRLPGIVITLLLEGASRKTRSQHSHANTRQAHSTSIPSRGVCEQPHSSYLAGLGSLCSAAPSAPRALFPPGAAGPGL